MLLCIWWLVCFSCVETVLLVPDDLYAFYVLHDFCAAKIFGALLLY